MVKKDMKVEIKDGLNVGTVALFIQKASQFDSAIYLKYGDKKVNAKSIINIASGEQISVSADGKDESVALSSIEKYLCCTH